MKKVWLITGCSRGLGLAWTKRALERGDCVIASARDINTLNFLKKKQYGKNILTVKIDVDDRESIQAALKEGIKRFGKIDVVVNNAGYSLFCPIENVSEVDSIAIINTNLLGSLRIIQETLPLLRQQQSGHILQISSIAGLTAFPGMGLYNATKWAIEGLIESLYHEVKQFGIKVSLVEPGPHATDWLENSSVNPPHNSCYPTRNEFIHNSWPRLPLSTIEMSADALIKLVDSDDPPLRLLVGKGLQHLVKDTLEQRIVSLAFYE